MVSENDTVACPVDPFCLGMCSWTGCPSGNADMATLEPHPQNEQLQPPTSTISEAEQPHPAKSTRFALASEKELAKLAEGLVPLNTAKTTNWALNNFEQRKSNRNQCNPTEGPIQDDIFTCIDPQTLNNTLSKFVVETRKANGELYPPHTLHQLLCGVLRHMRSKNPACPNFLDKKDARFSQLHKHLILTSINCILKE